MKRTPGKWDWKMKVLDDGDERVIFVDEQGNEIHPTLEGNLTEKKGPSIMYFNILTRVAVTCMFMYVFYHDMLKSQTVAAECAHI